MCEIPYVFLSVKLTGALAEAERREHTCLRFHTLITPLQLGVYPSVHKADILFIVSKQLEQTGVYTEARRCPDTLSK